MHRVRRILVGLLLLALLVGLAPALYYWGTTWIRGPVEVQVDAVFPVGNKGTLEARVVDSDGEVQRVLNRDQEILFWKFDSEGVDNRLSTARREGRTIRVWLSGLYLPLFGDTTLFNHLNVLAVDPALPPGALPAAVYLLLALVLVVAVRRTLRRVGASARRLAGRGDATADAVE